MQIKALIYCRVSSDRQVNEGHGLESQEKRCRDYAKSKGYEVVGQPFFDEGVSGGTADRPAIKELVAYIDDHQEQGLVCVIDDLSRLARDVQVYLYLKTQLTLRKVRLESPNFNFEDTPEGEFIENVLASKAQLDRQQNRRQVIQKQKARLELGYWPLCMPPGLKNFKDPVRGKILKPDGSPEAIVRKAAIEKFASGELRVQDDVRLFVHRELKKLGVDTKPLSHHGVQSLLKNPLNFGMIEYQPWGIPLARGKHDGLVSPDLYPIVLSRFDSKPKLRLRKDYTDDFPLRGLVRCSWCGGPLTGSWSTGRYGRKYPKYDCKTLGCPMRWKTIHRDKIHAQFLELLTGVKPESGLIDLTVDVLNDVWSQHKASYETEKAEKGAKLKLLELEIEGWSTRIAKTRDEALLNHYESQLGIKLADKKELEARSYDRQYSSEELGTATEVVLKTLEDPVSMWQNPDGYKRRTIALMYFDDKLRFDKDTGFGTTTLSRPIALMKELSGQKVPDVEMRAVKPCVEK